MNHQLKKISILVVASLLLTNFSIHAQKYTFAKFERYAQANKELGAPTKNEKRVVFMGNSITDGWARIRKDFFEQNKLIGRGISGQTSYQFLLRFREDVLNLQPKIVIINYGTNDIAENTGPYNEDYTFGNIVSMVEMARYNKIKVVLTSTLPAGEFPWRKEIKDSMKKVIDLNRRVKAYAEKEKIPYVDYFSALLSKDKTRLDIKYSKDGIHPNAEGYAIMEALILPVIKKLR